MKKQIILFIAAFGLSLSVTASQLNLSQLEAILPLYVEWAENIDKEGQKSGVPLDKKGLQLAKELGIKHPEKVRLVYTDKVPFPIEVPEIKAMGEAIGFVGDGIVNNAQAFGYAIYIRNGYKLDTPKLAHELVHVQQIERSASFADFALIFLRDLAAHGHNQAPLEVEAYEANKKYALQ